MILGKDSKGLDIHIVCWISEEILIVSVITLILIYGNKDLKKGRKQKSCLLYKRKLKNKLSTFMVENNNAIIIIKNVPSQVYKQCGEVSYSLEITLKLEEISEKLEPLVTEIAIFEYKKISE